MPTQLLNYKILRTIAVFAVFCACAVVGYGQDGFEPPLDWELEGSDLTTEVQPDNDPTGRTIISRLGVISLDAAPPKRIAFQVGDSLKVGTHTQCVDAFVGLGGSLPFELAGRDFRFDYRATTTFAAYERQWSYQYQGFQQNSNAEIFLGTQRTQLNPRSFGAGLRFDWYYNRSWDQIGGEASNIYNDYSVLDQRLGTYFFQYDYADVGQAGGFHRYRLEVGNDAGIFLGDKGDDFRTAQVTIRKIRQFETLQLRLAMTLDLFTGEVDVNRTTSNQYGDPVYDTNGLAFSEQSQGFLGFEIGASLFRTFGANATGEFGFDLTLGPDSEELRDFFQNQLVHRPSGLPAVPLVDRPGRFRADLQLFFVLHYGAPRFR